VRELSAALADRGISIEDLHTELVDGSNGGAREFRVRALLFVPNAVAREDLQRTLDALANAMRLDLALGEREASGATRG
jgi:glycine cleavage system regulatory protein